MSNGYSLLSTFVPGRVGHIILHFLVYLHQVLCYLCDQKQTKTKATMRIKFIAVWGLLMSSTIGSPIAQPKPIPKPAPLPIPREGPYQGIAGGLMGLEPKDKIALAALLTGTVLTIVNKIYDQWMARKTFHVS